MATVVIHKAIAVSHFSPFLVQMKTLSDQNLHGAYVEPTWSLQLCGGGTVNPEP